MVLYGCQFEKNKSCWNIWKNPWSYIYDCLVKYHIDFVTFFAPKNDLIFCNFLKICIHSTEFRKIIPLCCTNKKNGVVRTSGKFLQFLLRQKYWSLIILYYDLVCTWGGSGETSDSGGRVKRRVCSGSCSWRFTFRSGGIITANTYKISKIT